MYENFLCLQRKSDTNDILTQAHNAECRPCIPVTVMARSRLEGIDSTCAHARGCVSEWEKEKKQRGGKWRREESREGKEREELKKDCKKKI